MIKWYGSKFTKRSWGRIWLCVAETKNEEKKRDLMVLFCPVEVFTLPSCSYFAFDQVGPYLPS